jgi:sugar phosphate isomerase/epimerase
MRIGCAVPVSEIRAARDLGFDFVELRVRELYPDGPESAFGATARLVDSIGVPAEVFAFLLPPELKVVGLAVDRDSLRSWVRTVARRASLLGGRVIVVGSGEARRVPAGFPSGRALGQLADFLKDADEEASKQGLLIALEAINRTETNLLHSLDEACSLVESLARPGLGVVADLYHMLVEGEPLSHLTRPLERLFHVQLADSGRRPPGQGCFDFWTAFTFLNSVGYEESVSLECSFSRFSEEGGPALDFVRRAMETTGSLEFLR